MLMIGRKIIKIYKKVNVGLRKIFRIRQVIFRNIFGHPQCSTVMKSKLPMSAVAIEAIYISKQTISESLI